MKNSYHKKKKSKKEQSLPRGITPMCGYRTVVTQIISSAFYDNFERGATIIFAKTCSVNPEFEKSVKAAIEFKIGKENYQNIGFDISDMIRQYVLTMFQIRND